MQHGTRKIPGGDGRIDSFETSHGADGNCWPCCWNIPEVIMSFSWAQAAKAWKANAVDWQPAQKILEHPECLRETPEARELGLQELLEYVAPYFEASFESNQAAAEQAEELYFTYLFNVTSSDREAVFLKACKFALETGSASEQPLLADTVCKAFLSVTLPRLLDLCDARFENDYDAVLVTYHDNGLFANVLQLLDALLLSKPGVPILVDWQRSGIEGHFQPRLCPPNAMGSGACRPATAVASGTAMPRQISDEDRFPFEDEHHLVESSELNAGLFQREPRDFHQKLQNKMRQELKSYFKPH
eukprot:s454_g9.t1